MTTTFADGSTRTNGYDPADDVISYVDENGNQFHNTFDALGRKTKVDIVIPGGLNISTATQSQFFQYDGLSRMVFARNSDHRLAHQTASGAVYSEVTLVHDSLSRLLEDAQFFQGNTRYVTNTAFTSYPATGFTFPTGRLVDTAFDLLYRRTSLAEHTDPTPAIAAWAFFGPAGGPGATGQRPGLHLAEQRGDEQRGRVERSESGLGRCRHRPPGLRRPGPDDHQALPPARRRPAHHRHRRLHRGVRPRRQQVLTSGPCTPRTAATSTSPSSARSRRGVTIRSTACGQYQRGTLDATIGFGDNGGGGDRDHRFRAPVHRGARHGHARTYVLDGLGNWTSTVFTPETTGTPQTETRNHNSLNEITQRVNGMTTISLSYDGVAGHSSGNLADDGTLSYVGTALNRLVQVTIVSTGYVIAVYAYDALNRRIRKIVSNGGLPGDVPDGTTDCIYSGWRCVEERNPFGGSRSTAPHCPVSLGHLSGRADPANAHRGRERLQRRRGVYPLQDLLYRTTGLADSSGTVLEAYDTDAYGNTLIFRGSPLARLLFAPDDPRVTSPPAPSSSPASGSTPKPACTTTNAATTRPCWGGSEQGSDGAIRTRVNPYGYVNDNPVNRSDPKRDRHLLGQHHPPANMRGPVAIEPDPQLFRQGTVTVVLLVPPGLL